MGLQTKSPTSGGTNGRHTGLKKRLFPGQDILWRFMTSPDKNPPNYLVVSLIFLAAGLAIFILVWQLGLLPTTKRLPEQLQATVLPKGKPIVGLSLKDQNGELFTEQNFKGKWSFLFFGFTNCPDICPTTMLVMKAVWAKLPASARVAPEPQMYFVSVDPQRDTPELLKAYATFYNPEFIGVTGNNNQLDVLVNQVGALYGYEDGEKEGEYTVNHSAQIILIDPNGKMRAVFSPPYQVDDIVNTFVSIREFFKD